MKNDTTFQYYVKPKHHWLRLARIIGRNKSTISREIGRNSGKRGYRNKQADAFAQSRKRKGNKQITSFGFAYIVYLIEQDWSPEQINGRLVIPPFLTDAKNRIHAAIKGDRPPFALCGLS